MISDFDFLSPKSREEKPPYSYAPIGYTYKFHIKGQIGSPDEFEEIIDVIDGATEKDILEVHLNTEGGDITTTLELVYSLKKSPAHKHMVICGLCASAGTIIMTAGDSFEIEPHCSFMFHNYSGGSYGKGNEVHAQVEFERKWSKNLMSMVYKDVLTTSEIKKMLDGQDYWMTATEVAERIVKMLEARQPDEEEEDAATTD